MKFLGLRLQLFYFFGIGISGVIFFLPVWLENRGIDTKAIGFIMAMTCLSKLIFGPISASLSDLGLNSKNLMSILALIGVVGLVSLLPVTNSYVYFVAILVATGGFLSTIPLGESLALSLCKSGKTKLDYGQIRAVGTVAYAVFAVFSGLVLNYLKNDDIVIYLMIACCVFIIISSRMISDERNMEQSKDVRSNYKSLLYMKDFKLVIAIQILYYVSSAMQTGFGSAYWKQAGIPTDVIGYLIIPMIASECIFFLSVKKYLSNIPYQTLLLISASVCVVRWTVLAFFVNPYVIALCQASHALTFASTHLAMMTYIRDVVPVNLSTRAQSVYDSGAAGVFLGLAIIMYGFTYDILGGYSFLLAAMFSFVAVILALKLKGIKLKKWKKTPLTPPTI